MYNYINMSVNVDEKIQVEATSLHNSKDIENMYAHMYTYVTTYVYLYMYVYIYILIFVNIRLHIQLHVHVYIYIYIYFYCISMCIICTQRVPCPKASSLEVMSKAGKNHT